MVLRINKSIFSLLLLETCSCCKLISALTTFSMMLRFTKSTTSIFSLLLLASKMAKISSAQPSEKYIYYVYYEDDGFRTQCQRDAVGVKGYVSGDEASVLGGEGENCAQEIACQLEMSSPNCQNLARTADGSVVTVITSDGRIQECDSTNIQIGLPECLFFQGCEESSTYPHCHFDIINTSDLQRNPELLVNDKTANDLEDYAYLVYYNDDQCTDVAGAKGAVSGAPFAFPKVSRGITCDDAMACVLQPDGNTCLNTLGVNQVREEDMARLKVEISNNKIYECDKTNDAVGEPTCAVLDPKPCRQSSSIANCHFRWISGQDLAKRPERLVSDFSAGATDTSSGSVMNDKFISTSTYALVAFALSWLFIHQ